MITHFGKTYDEAKIIALIAVKFVVRIVGLKEDPTTRGMSPVDPIVDRATSPDGFARTCSLHTSCQLRNSLFCSILYCFFDITFVTIADFARLPKKNTVTFSSNKTLLTPKKLLWSAERKIQRVTKVTKCQNTLLRKMTFLYGNLSQNAPIAINNFWSNKSNKSNVTFITF